jgi:signal recognition particle subunit SRP54
MVLDKLREGLQSAIKKLVGADTIDEETVKEFVNDLFKALLQADVQVKQAAAVTERVKRRALEEKPPPGLPRKDHIIKILYEELSGFLGSEGNFELPTGRASILLMMGIQGSGKTTIVGKLSRFLVKKGYAVGVVCADTYRPGALVQLKTNAERAGVEVFGDEKEKDAVKLARIGVEHFKTNGKNVIIVDTAGRHKEEKGLLDEMKTISSKITPDYTLLVIDGTIGQQCYAQADAFHKSVPVGGIIITKLDGAAKGGGALAAAAATGAKILFIGTGERIDDLESFSPTRFVGRLLGMGDIKALLEKAKELETEADEAKLQRIVSGKMTIDDLYYQLEQVRKMGSIRKILELVPGFSGAVKDEDMAGIEQNMDKWKFIIQSMTKEERADPDILNSSRMKRIAKGSGRNEKEIKDMLQRYKQTKTVLKATKGRGMRQMLRRLPTQ